MTTRLAVLIVDDDALVLRTVERALFADFDITTATSSKQAMDALSGPRQFAAIVADLRMPGGDGLELLQFVRARYPNMVRIMLSGMTQMRDAIAAVNEGQVFRLLTKPFQLATMRQTLQAAVEQHRLLTSERVLLEETLKGSIKALTDILAIVQPLAFGRATRMRQHSMDLAERIGLARCWDVEVAALLSQIGCVTLDENTLTRWYRGDELTPQERTQVDRLPEVAIGLVAHIPRLDSVINILRRQFEPSDAKELPQGSAVLAIARDYDVLTTEGHEPDAALATMDARGAQYSTELMNHFRAIRGAHSSTEIVQEILLKQVSESMTFAADVHSENGLLLIARGQRVTPMLLSRLRMQSFALAASMKVRMIVDAHAIPETA